MGLDQVIKKRSMTSPSDYIKNSAGRVTLRPQVGVADPVALSCFRSLPAPAVVVLLVVLRSSKVLLLMCASRDPMSHSSARKLVDTCLVRAWLWSALLG